MNFKYIENMVDYHSHLRRFLAIEWLPDGAMAFYDVNVDGVDVRWGVTIREMAFEPEESDIAMVNKIVSYENSLCETFMNKVLSDCDDRVLTWSRKDYWVNKCNLDRATGFVLNPLNAAYQLLPNFRSAGEEPFIYLVCNPIMGRCILNRMMIIGTPFKEFNGLVYYSFGAFVKSDGIYKVVFK